MSDVTKTTELFDAAQAALCELDCRRQAVAAAEAVLKAATVAAKEAKTAADKAIGELARSSGVLDTSIVYKRGDLLYRIDTSNAEFWVLQRVTAVCEIYAAPSAADVEAGS